MNYLHLSLYLGVGIGFPAIAWVLRKKLTSGPRLFAAFTAVGIGFAMLNVGPLGPIIGFPSILMSAGLCSYLTTRSKS